MADNKNLKTNLPFLNNLERELLTPEQAKIMNQFDQNQHRRDIVYEGHTVPVSRVVLEDRTPNGSMDRYGRLTVGCNTLGLKGVDAKIATGLAHGHTQQYIAKLLKLSMRQVRYRIMKMRECPWYSWGYGTRIQCRGEDVVDEVT